MPLQLAVTEQGDGPPVAVLHGLFGSGRNWASIARRLAARYRVLAFDLRNHGASPWADTMRYAEMADDVRATLQAYGISRCAWIGHSMGGKVAMQAALVYGDEIDRLVVVDIAPVAYPARHVPFVRAMEALDLTTIKRRAEADERLAVHVHDPAERGFLLQNLVFDPGEPPRWRLNLETISREMPTLVGTPPLPDGARYVGPALFVGGANSDYVLPTYVPEIRRLFPSAAVHRIANAGHWLHAEQPQVFLDIVEPFLAAN
jgi:pimeloyl-ACP methyl ester carboxylesterase